METKKRTASEKAAIEKAAHEYHLKQAKELLSAVGYVEGPSGGWTAASMGKRGGKARAKKLNKAQLSAIGRKGAKKRWATKPKKGGK